jgi:hypothetical protein
MKGEPMLPDQIRKAEIAMVKVCLRALQLGAFVSKPVFEGARYDYIIEIGGKLYRAQVKYADGKHRSISGAVEVNLRKQIKKNRNHPYDENEIDVLLVYVPKICWFGPEIFSGKQGISIRLVPHQKWSSKGLYCGGRPLVVTYLTV